jgi:transposase InsO family protein
MRTLAKIEVSWKLYLEGVEPERIASAVSVHRATVYRWIAGVKRTGSLRAYLKRYEAAKRRTRQLRIHPDAVRLLVARRKEKPGVCGQKLSFWLMKTHGIAVSVATIYRRLAAHFTFRKKVKWEKRPPLPRATRPREVIQVDKIDLGFLWIHNFIDCFTREVVVADETSRSAAEAGKLARACFGPVEWLQSDNGSEYKGKFDRLLKGWRAKRRRITPGKKEENGFVESFNRTLRSECVGWGLYFREDLLPLQDRVNTYLDEYHTERPHLSLNLQTPNEFCLSHLTGDKPIY